jgi:hypothetical protein
MEIIFPGEMFLLCSMWKESLYKLVGIPARAVKLRIKQVLPLQLNAVTCRILKGVMSQVIDEVNTFFSGMR